MKKVLLAVASLALVAGVACGGSGWSDADKAKLNQGISLAKSFGVLTDKQADCYSKWIQSHYDSMADAQNAEDDSNAARSLFKACDIDPSAVGYE